MNWWQERLKIKKWLNGRSFERQKGDRAPTLILFYSPKCHGCLFTAFPLLLELYRQVDPDKLRFLAIQIHEVPDQFFNERFDLTRVEFPVGLDDELQTYRLFDCSGTPHWFLVDAEGRILHSIFGSDRGSLAKLSYALMEVLGIPVELE